MFILNYYKIKDKILVRNNNIYSQTCEQRPPKGDTDYGLYRKVVSIWRFLYFN